MTIMFPFFINAIIAISIISIAASLIGTYIMSRRQTFIAGGITHACFGGLGLGYFLNISPILTAMFFAVAGSLSIEHLKKKGLRSDSAIAFIWALGMALGILFVFLTSGYVPELNSFLFGNMLTVSRSDILIFAGFTLVLILFYAFFYRRIITVSFDEAFARTRHLPVSFINTLMTIFVAIAIVLTIKMIGIMLLMSMISIPQITAEIFAKRYRSLIISSALISLLASSIGVYLAFLVSVPASAMIVLLMSAIYLMTQALRRVL